MRTITRLCAIWSMLFLAACAEQQPTLTPVDVDVPVSVPCKVVPVVAPDFALAHVTPKDTLFAKAKAALVEIDQRKAYEAVLEADVKACG